MALGNGESVHRIAYRLSLDALDANRAFYAARPVPQLELPVIEPDWWLRFKGGRVWHRAREVCRVGTTEWVTLPTVCGFSGEFIAEVKFATIPTNQCARCRRASGGNAADDT